MKRFVCNKDSAYTRATKISRICSTSAGAVHVVDSIPSNANLTSRLLTDSIPDNDEDIHPNVLLERLLREKVDKMVQKHVSTSQSRQISISGEKIIAAYDPDNHEMNIRTWLAKIDQLGLVHNWNDYTKIVIMQTKLVGQAQQWFSALENYEHTWEEWKGLLIKAFPIKFDYADMLENLCKRKKEVGESFTHYYHDKLAMCRRCKFDDDAALSCIIKGLPSELINNARAYKCETPEEFYIGYLSTFENFNAKKMETNNNYRPSFRQDSEKRRNEKPSNSRGSATTPTTQRNCFRCNSADHMVKDCPFPDRRVCKFCNAVGHSINKCPKIENIMKTKQINIIHELNDIYKKDITICGKKMLGYLDTGAQLNVITLEAVRKLKLMVTETDAILKGFTGDVVPAMGQTKIEMEVDGLKLNTTAVVTHLQLPSGVDVLLGQPVINSKGISLLTTKSSANLVTEREYDVEETDGNLKITTNSAECIQSNQSKIVEVSIIGNEADCNVCTKPRIHELNGEHYALPATLLYGTKGFVRVYNFGKTNLEWKKNHLVARAVSCEPIEEQSEGRNDNHDENHEKLHAGEIEMGAQLKWGVAGVGMIAHDFLTALGTLPPENHRVVAVAGKDLERVRRLASMHNIATAYEGYEALADDCAIDIVFVSVLNLQHYEVAKLMLERGKHVLCEKPMGMTYKQTKALVDLAREKRLFLLEGMWSRFFPAYDALDKHIAAGGMGDIYHINIQFGVEINEIERNLMKDLGGGAVLDLGIYMLQLAQFIYKDAPTDIVSTGHLSKAGVDESVSCALKYKYGRTATFSAHTRATMTNRAEIIGTKGTISLEYFWCPTALHISAANSTEWTLPKGRFKFHFHNSAGLSYQIHECWSCINEGLIESPKMTLDESLLLSKLTDSIRAQVGVLENGH